MAGTRHLHKVHLPRRVQQHIPLQGAQILRQFNGRGLVRREHQQGLFLLFIQCVEHQRFTGLRKTNGPNWSGPGGPRPIEAGKRITLIQYT